jgi:WD40 repeat protein
MSNAHKTAVSCLCVVDENVLASGDDDGTVKIWDLRQAKCVHEMSEHEDYISDIQLAKDEKTLLCSGGDGYLRCLSALCPMLFDLDSCTRPGKQALLNRVHVE